MVITLAAAVRADETVAINSTNFPCDVFRQYVNGNFDVDSDGNLSESELENVTQINLHWRVIEGLCSVTSLQGIEFFTNLEELLAAGNQLSELNTSYNPALKVLDVGFNNITKINLSNNTALERLDVSVNQLTELHISNNPNLTWLDVKYNQLTGIDVRNNPTLEMLDVSFNKLIEIDVSSNPNLNLFDVRWNQLIHLDVSSNPVLINLIVSDNQLTKLDMSNNPALRYLFIERNQLTEIDVSGAPYLSDFLVGCNQLTELNIRNNSNLRWLGARNNLLAELDVSNNPYLTYLDVDDNVNVTRNTSPPPYPPCDHIPGEWTFVKYPTCATRGEKNRSCVTCHAVIGWTFLPVTDHNWTEIPAVAATCTQPGRTAGRRCATCNTTEQGAVTTALGHTPAPSGNRAPTFFATGIAGRTVCRNCNTIIARGRIVQRRTLARPRVTLRALGNRRVRVSTNRVANANRYQFRFRRQGQRAWRNGGFVSGRNRNIARLTRGRNYQFRVRAVRVQGRNRANGPWSVIRRIRVR